MARVARSNRPGSRGAGQYAHSHYVLWSEKYSSEQESLLKRGLLCADCRRSAPRLHCAIDESRHLRHDHFTRLVRTAHNAQSAGNSIRLARMPKCVLLAGGHRNCAVGSCLWSDIRSVRWTTVVCYVGDRTWTDLRDGSLQYMHVSALRGTHSRLSTFATTKVLQ